MQQSPSVETRADVPTWHLVGASVPGRAHLRADLPCQDASFVGLLPCGLLLLVTADGAGSAPRARDGAHEVVDRSVSILSDALEDGCSSAEDAAFLIRATVEHVHGALLALAAREALPPNHFAATLGLALISKSWLVAGQIGDGVIVAQDEGGFQIVIPPQRGEHVNETLFLTSAPGPDALEVRSMAPAPRAVAMMTDGLAALAVHQRSGEAHAPFFAPLLKFAAQMSSGPEADQKLAAFLRSDRVSDRTGDDKTLLLAVRAAPEIVPEGVEC